MKAFTVAGVLLVALLTGATGKPSPPPGPPLPGPPAVIEPGAPPSTLPALSDLPSLREPSGRSVAPPGSATAPTSAAAGDPNVKPTSTPSPAATTEASRRSTGWIGLGVVIVIAGAVAFLVLRRRRHA